MYMIKPIEQLQDVDWYYLSIIVIIKVLVALRFTSFCPYKILEKKAIHIWTLDTNLPTFGCDVLRLEE